MFKHEKPIHEIFEAKKRGFFDVWVKSKYFSVNLHDHQNDPIIHES